MLCIFNAFDMILRFAAENIMSFKDAIEFNTFTSSRSQSHEWHKVNCNGVDALRMSAIYGANGAGKSNLLKCIDLLKEMVSSDKLSDLNLKDDLYFKFDPDDKLKPSELAIEFFTNNQTFYYHIVFNRKEVIEEELFLSGGKEDIPIYRRKNNDVILTVENIPEKGKDDFIKVFSDAMSRIIRPDMLVLSFFGNYYSEEFPVVKDAYEWIRKLQIVLPGKRFGFLVHTFDVNQDFADLANEILPELKTGITRLFIKKEVIDEKDIDGNPGLRMAIDASKEHPGEPQMYKKAALSNEICNIVVENGTIVLKSLVALHIDKNGNEVPMDLEDESDGTRRLIEYMPLIYTILKGDAVYIVDEIERSIHPILIKSIISKISDSHEAKGQLIFTTHESCLLDQSIFRPDEIWFAQKDVDQSTQLYPLSDYNIHKTANIENGYLNGRYGGIPFLSNLSDLKW